MAVVVVVVTGNEDDSRGARRATSMRAILPDDEFVFLLSWKDQFDQCKSAWKEGWWLLLLLQLPRETESMTVSRGNRVLGHTHVRSKGSRENWKSSLWCGGTARCAKPRRNVSPLRVRNDRYNRRNEWRLNLGRLFCGYVSSLPGHSGYALLR